MEGLDDLCTLARIRLHSHLEVQWKDKYGILWLQKIRRVRVATASVREFHCFSCLCCEDDAFANHIEVQLYDLFL